jgi:preprotein translocase subunit SecE
MDAEGTSRAREGENGMELFEIYKRGQGKYTRIVTVAGAMLVGVIGAYVLSDTLTASLGGVKLGEADIGLYLAFGIPTLIVLVLGAIMFWLVNRPSSADFLIATESEMKKVSWSSRKEVVGSTKVVIVTTFMLAGILYGVDVLFVLLFHSMKIGV